MSNPSNARRVISKAFANCADQNHYALRRSVDQVVASPVVACIGLAALAHLSAVADLELSKPELMMEAKITSDLIHEISAL